MFYYRPLLSQVFIAGKNNGQPLRTLKPGDAFGELALMYNSPRTATVKVESQKKGWPLVRLWHISHSTKLVLSACARRWSRLLPDVADKIVPCQLRSSSDCCCKTLYFVGAA